MEKRRLSFILLSTLLSGGLCSSVKRNYNYNRRRRGYVSRSFRSDTRRTNRRIRRLDDRNFISKNKSVNEIYDEDLEFRYNKFRRYNSSNSNLKKILSIGGIGVGILLIGGVVYIVSSDGEKQPIVNPPFSPKPITNNITNIGHYQPEPSTWDNLCSKQIGNLTVRVYNGNITQIGHDEDVFRVQSLNDAQHTAIVSPDNNNLSPGVLAGLISCAQNNKKRIKNGNDPGYKDINSLKATLKTKFNSDSIPSGQAIVGNAGGYLKVAKIVHAVAPCHNGCSNDNKCKCKQNLMEVYYNSIVEADSAGMKRIVFPPMGDQTYGNSTQSSAQCFASAVKKLNDGNKLKNIKHIDVAIHSSYNASGMNQKTKIFSEAVNNKL